MIRNRLMVKLDQKFINARKADDFLCSQVGTANIHILDDSQCQKLLDKLIFVKSVRYGSEYKQKRR